MPESHAVVQLLEERDGSLLPTDQYVKVDKAALTKSFANEPVRKKAGDYKHLSFVPTKKMKVNCAEGVKRHEAGETKGHADEEHVAMARHIEVGGHVSPSYVRKAAEFHGEHANYHAAKEGTAAYALSKLMGGPEGKEFYESLAKSMDDADAAPDTSVAENGVQAAITKAEGASENDLASGGATVPEGSNVVKIPKCPLCKSEEYVAAAQEPVDPVKGKMYQCAMCESKFGEAESIAANGEVTQGQQLNPGDGDGDELPGGKTKSVTGAVTKAKKDNDGNDDDDDDDDVEKTKAEGSVVVNHDTVARAASLIDHGHYTDADWEAPNGGDRKPEDCLGKRQGEDVQPAERCVAPVIKNGQVYAHAVADAESRMSGSAVGEAAAALMRKIQAHRESSAKTKSMSQEQVNKAVEREIDSREDRILAKAIEKATDLAVLAMGGV